MATTTTTATTTTVTATTATALTSREAINVKETFFHSLESCFQLQTNFKFCSKIVSKSQFKYFFRFPTGQFLFYKNGPNPASFCLFLFISQWKDNCSKIDKSVDGVLGSRTQVSRMEGADKSSKLWRHHIRHIFRRPFCFLNISNSKYNNTSCKMLHFNCSQ